MKNLKFASKLKEKNTIKLKEIREQNENQSR